MKCVPALVDHLHHVVSNSPPGQLRRDRWMSGARTDMLLSRSLNGDMGLMRSMTKKGSN